jgi:hypothetical protein
MDNLDPAAVVALSIISALVFLALDGFVFYLAASLCNLDNVVWLRAYILVVIELVIGSALSGAGYLLLMSTGHPVEEFGTASGQDYLVVLPVAGGVVLGLLLLGALVFMMGLPTSYWTAIKIWVLRTLLALLVIGLVGGVVLAVMALAQGLNPRRTT